MNTNTGSWGGRLRGEEDLDPKPDLDNANVRMKYMLCNVCFKEISAWYLLFYFLYTELHKEVVTDDIYQ